MFCSSWAVSRGSVAIAWQTGHIAMSEMVWKSVPHQQMTRKAADQLGVMTIAPTPNIDVPNPVSRFVWFPAAATHRR